jgi:hypothetical protein
LFEIATYARLLKFVCPFSATMSSAGTPVRDRAASRYSLSGAKGTVSASGDRRRAATSARTSEMSCRNTMCARFMPSHVLLVAWPNWISFFA